MMKRYKVVRDANGSWGVLDTLAEKAGDLESFAAWEGVRNLVKSGWIDGIVTWAADLNSMKADRDNLWWEHYEPRKADSA